MKLEVEKCQQGKIYLAPNNHDNLKISLKHSEFEKSGEDDSQIIFKFIEKIKSLKSDLIEIILSR